jgi:hypothetical protein
MRFSRSAAVPTVSLLAGLLAAACSDSTAPLPSRPGAELTILQLGPAAPALETNSVTFTACKGVDAEGRIGYVSTSGEQEDFARLKLDGASLFARPDGTPYQNGECERITMSVVDPTAKQVQVELQPSGLKFSLDHPAELRLDYGEAEGVDAEVESKIGIWRQETPGDPFVLVGTAVLKDSKEVEAKLFGFSRYALAY